jgi:hypothetical protein
MTNGAFCHPKKSPAARNSTERRNTKWAIDLTQVNRRHCIIGPQRQNRATVWQSGEFSVQHRIGSCWVMCRYAAVFLVAVEKGRGNSRGNNLGRKVKMNRSWVIALLAKIGPGTYTMFEWRASQIQNPLGLSPVHILI